MMLAMDVMDRFVPIALLVLAWGSLALALFTWRAGGKHQVMTSSILVSATTALVLPDGSGIQLGIRILAASLIFLALMITPRVRVRRMRAELALAAAAIALVWALAVFALEGAAAAVCLLLLAALVASSLVAMVLRRRTEEQAQS